MSLGSMVDIYRTSCYFVVINQGSITEGGHHISNGIHLETTFLVVSMIVAQGVQEPNDLFRIHNLRMIYISIYVYIYIIYNIISY